MSEDRSAFNNYQVIPEGTWAVDGIGNTKLQVVGKGDIQIESRIQGIFHSETIYNVLHVPHLGVNLIFIAAMTSLGAEVAFIANKVKSHTQQSDCHDWRKEWNDAIRTRNSNSTNQVFKCV